MPVSVEQGVAILETCGFDADFSSPNKLPMPDQTDEVHREWRESLILAARERGIAFSHGVAAKLVNVYLKVRFVCAGNHADVRVQCLHPPIDRMLLKALAESNFGGLGKRWKSEMNKGWSKFNSADYQGVVDMIRSALGGRPTWTVE